MFAKSPLDKDFSDNDEPSVLSSDPNERKLARRLRIQRRSLALQKLEAEDAAEVVEESLTEKQIAASADFLEKLITEGNEVISNVRIANDARELERRERSSEIRKIFLSRLDDNAKTCKEQYDVINDQWASIFRSNDPLVIKEEMEWQRKKCEQVLAQKDAVIDELKHELERIDREYFNDQAKQKDDIKLLIERIENQMSSMENFYSQELELIKKMLKTESDAVVNNFRNKWDTLYKQQENEDEAANERKEKIMREHEDEMERVMRQHEEEYREQKIRLEKESQVMQQQLEKTRALCQLNTEKLEYNYTTLKNREEENAIVKAQQKRKINRLQTLINNLKKNYAELEENTSTEIEKLSNYIMKKHSSIRELEDKSAQFSRINEKKYHDIWDMNAEIANDLVKKILEVDRSIHENILGILWEPPVKELPRKEDLPSYRLALTHIQRKKDDDKYCNLDKVRKSLSEEESERQVYHNILKQIANNSKFLIEDKLKKLITNCNDEEKTIISLDSIFDALSITTPAEINVVMDVFMPYTFCTICNAECDASSENITKSSTPSEICAKTCEGCKDEKLMKLIDSIKEEVEANRQNIRKLEGRSSSLDRSRSEILGTEEYEPKCGSLRCDSLSSKPVTRKYTCNRGHILDIHSAHVVKAMKEVVARLSHVEQKEMLSFEERLKEKKYTTSRNLSTDDVKYFWSCYREMFGPDKEKLWDAILVGLNKYYEVLKERNKLCNEIDGLYKHNSELQRLLESQTKSIDDSPSSLHIKSAKCWKY